MKDLVIIENEKLFTTTLVIAKGCNLDHRSVMKLLKTHKNTEILLRFEIAKVSRGGRPVEYAKLTELQTTFLITLMRNSEIIVKFKETLTKEFFKQRSIISNLIAQRKDENWKTVRKDGIAIYKPKTDKIKEFVEYAISQGSKNAKNYYANLANMENKALFVFEKRFPNMREVMTIRQLLNLSTADHIIENSLTESMDKGLPYKDCYLKAKEAVQKLAQLVGRSPVLAIAINNQHLK